MIDTVKLKLDKFKFINRVNFNNPKRPDSLVPLIDTLENNSCYWSLPTNGNYQEFLLKSHIKYQPFGYKPAWIVVKDIPFSRNRIRFWLEIEISLPKVFNGHNFYELQENQFNGATQAIYNMLLQFGIQIDIEELRTTTNIIRIDYCKNTLIQSPVKDFIKLLQKLHKSRSRICYEYESSILFGNKQQGLAIYDKVTEVTKVLRDKYYNNRESKEYQVAKILDTYRKVHGLEVIRIEHRLFNQQTIKRELSPLVGFYPFTFKDLFNSQVSSKLLLKHWSKTLSEEKLKLLLLGEKNLSFIFDEVKKALGEKSKGSSDQLAFLIKLFSEVGEVETTKRILKTKSISTVDKNKKSLNELIQQVFFMIPDLRIIKRLLNHFKILNRSFYQLSQIFNMKNSLLKTVMHYRI